MKEFFFKAVKAAAGKCAGTPSYSKNQTVVYTAIFLCAVAVFIPNKITHFSSQLKNQYTKNIIQAVSQPMVDFAQMLPFSAFFANARKNVLTVCGVQNDYHWDNFYYTEKNALTVAACSDGNGDIDKAHALPEMQTGDAHTFSPSALLAEKAKALPENNSLLVAHYDYTKEHPLRILFAGDSQMQSIAEGFKRNIGTESAFEAIDLAVVSSGFIRTDYYNWPAKFTALFKEVENEEKPFDVVVLLLGMNDYQNFFDGNGKLFRFGTDEWIAAYIEKIKTVMNILQSSVKKVYWLGLPAVKSPSLNADITAVENAQIKAMAALADTNVQRISLRELISGGSSVYTDQVQTADGKRIQLMREDGTHYSLAGGSFVMSEIEKYFYFDFNIEKYKSITH